MPRMPRMPRTGTRRATASNGAAQDARQIWVLRDGQPVAIAVKTGISDGRMTEITDGDLKEGMAVITDQRAGAASKP
ncbi:MAG: hypothetical protein CVU24_14635 [Betaproteobacteria bacterium HGW-Betaproteobacteria-18]|nr:MAG: hypothetical protein CVU24_14635 [Betaproteobacteria bacterium HGW-Betaproteobacteria-18]